MNNREKIKLIKNGLQKLSDKAEPKFKDSDWVVRELDNKCYQIKRCILNVTNNKYGYDLTSGGYISSQDANFYHLWTIQDAKAGDVLADGNLPFIFKKIDTNKYSYAYCGISVDDGFKIESDGELGEWTWMQDIKPATKEQRNLLFQKMYEAGFEWDAEKKELKKIAWSEEDEEMHRKCICAMRASACGFPEEEKFVEQVDNWLKSLRP